LEENQVYNLLKTLLTVAENRIGSIEEVSMGDWLKTKERICIEGKTLDGKPYELTLEVDNEVAEIDS
jgi:hypothetical protein